MKLSNILKEVRSTVIGLACLVVALWGAIKHEDFNNYQFWTLMVIGILLVFSPDLLVNKLGDLLNKLVTWIFGSTNQNSGDTPDVN